MSAAAPVELLQVAREASAAGSTAAAGMWRSRTLAVEEKAGPHDLVSQADRRAEAAILEVLRARRPSDAVLAEESESLRGTSGITWAVDPIDGTTSYLYGRPDWAVSVAAIDDTGHVLAAVVEEPAQGRVTEAACGGGTWCDGERLGPLRQRDLGRALVELNLGRPEQKASFPSVVERLVPAVRDIRRGGSAAAALAAVAGGRADIAWVPGLQPWDCAAGILLVVEAGGLVGDLDGATGAIVPESGDVLAAPPALFEPSRALLVEAVRHPSASRSVSPRSTAPVDHARRHA
jgi:myo-inositol-1(or 4)-monophosphatase